MDKAVLAMMLLCAFLLPWNFLVAPCGTFLAVFWLMSFNWKEKWINIRNAPMIWLWIAFAVLHVAGYFWSANKSEAATNLMVKLGIFIFPIIFAATRLDEIKTKRVLQAFLAGLILVGMFMLARAIYFASQGIGKWSYQDFADRIMHPSYLSLYYVVGIMICFHGILLRKVPVTKKIIGAAFILFFSLMVFMLASKTGIISLVVVFLFYIGYAVVRFRRYVVAGISLIVLVAAFFIALKVFPVLQSRLEVMTQVISSDAPINPADVESNRVRLLIWQADLELISEHPFTGVGPGDVQDELMKKYEANGMTGAKDKRLNAHSQFFQTGIALGLPGIILLAGIFLAAFVVAVRTRFGFLALFTMLLVFNFIPESMLQVQAGTLFMGFFYSLILFAADKKVLSPKS
ncbi:MAG TPA: O-antigen ligase family protein [Bacteroidia bacterium]|nr:O-antigen ligase family protein [Bacteroidia bacterium]